MRIKELLSKRLLPSLLLMLAPAVGVQAQDMTATPLTLEATTSGDITFNLKLGYGVDASVMNAIEYKKNDDAWKIYTWGEAISVVNGDKVAFRGNNTKYYGNGTPSYESHIASTADVYVYGNIMSIINSTDFATLTTLTGKDAFSHLFSVPGSTIWEVVPNTTIKSHPTKDLVLPATTLTNMCYMNMFSGCQGLTRAPELPATELPVACYASMFEGCTSLTEAPVLPTTTFTPYGFDDITFEEYGSIDCYMGMFKDCISLKKAPALPATTLIHGVYQNMFQGCTSLERAPDLPAPIVADYAYSYMFDGCTSLNYVKCLATDFYIDPDFQNTAEDNVNNWLNNVAATGTFVKADGMTAWAEGASGIPAGWTVQEEGDPEPGPFVAAETPLTIEAIEDGTTVTITNPLALTIECSFDGGASWASSNAAPITISGIAAGSTVQLRANNAAYSDGTIANSTIISFDKDCYVYGNIMSLVNSTGFATTTTLTANYAFFDLFDSNEHLKNHDTKDFVLPATTLTEGCYSNMFYKCTALTKAPVLPATTLAKKCYERMFQTCKAMTTAPALPATSLADYCYSFMFYACNTLQSAPSLPATVMVDHCYSNMFGFCHAFTNTPELPATTLAENCYYRMFVGCNGLTTITSLPATTMAAYCYNEMFRQCQALKNGPVLPATKLADYCYRCMFQACTALENPSELPATELSPGCYLGMFVNTGLTTTPALPAKTLAKSCYYQMFQNCQKLVSSSTLPATELAEMSYYKMFADCPLLENAGDLSATTAAESSCEYMFQNCTSMVTAPVLSATTLAPACYNYMFSGCTKLTKAPALPATKLDTQCYQRMFEFCSGLVDAPELPATELAELCYNDMFWECTSLKNAPVLPATTLADYCYTMMFMGCTSLETAPVLPAATLTPGCYEHMFMNCNKLNYVKCLATDLGDDTSTDGWMTNVAATGTFVKAASADWSTKGTTDGTWGDPGEEVACTFIHGIPTGWTVWDDTSTAIEQIVKDDIIDSKAIYDLQGRRVTPSAPGLYIVNGKIVYINK